MAKIPSDVVTHLAWTFESVLPGSFRRNKQAFAGIDFPILAPLPSGNTATEPVEGANEVGPFVYFVSDRLGEVHYVGKSKEKTVIRRWVRPGTGGPATHYWSHTNKSAGCVRRMAEGIRSGQGPFTLRFVSVAALPLHYLDRFFSRHPEPDVLESIEKGFISLLNPTWNVPGR
jgi:hypothetical protein